MSKHRITYKGITLDLHIWAEKFDVAPRLLYQRFKRGDAINAEFFSKPKDDIFWTVINLNMHTYPEKKQKELEELIRILFARERKERKKATYRKLAIEIQNIEEKKQVKTLEDRVSDLEMLCNEFKYLVKSNMQVA